MADTLFRSVSNERCIDFLAVEKKPTTLVRHIVTLNSLRSIKKFGTGTESAAQVTRDIGGGGQRVSSVRFVANEEFVKEVVAFWEWVASSPC